MAVHQVCLSLGFNIQPERYLPLAVAALRQVGEVAALSRVWQSAAIGAPEQPDYCNMAVLLLTEHSLESLLSAEGPLRRIEAALGRVPHFAAGVAPRTIDIDLTLFDREARSVGKKHVPHPDLFSRACIAAPLLELPGVELPGSDVSLPELARELQASQPLAPRPDIDALMGPPGMPRD